MPLALVAVNASTEGFSVIAGRSTTWLTVVVTDP